MHNHVCTLTDTHTQPHTQTGKIKTKKLNISMWLISPYQIDNEGEIQTTPDSLVL